MVPCIYVTAESIECRITFRWVFSTVSLKVTEGNRTCYVGNCVVGLLFVPDGECVPRGAGIDRFCRRAQCVCKSEHHPLFRPGFSMVSWCFSSPPGAVGFVSRALFRRCTVSQCLPATSCPEDSDTLTHSQLCVSHTNTQTRADMYSSLVQRLAP